MKKIYFLLLIIFCSSLQSEPFSLSNVIKILYNNSSSAEDQKPIQSYRDNVINEISLLKIEDKIFIDSSPGAAVYMNCKFYWPSTLTLLCIPATFLFTRWYYTGKILS